MFRKLALSTDVLECPDSKFSPLKAIFKSSFAAQMLAYPGVRPRFMVVGGGIFWRFGKLSWQHISIFLENRSWRFGMRNNFLCSFTIVRRSSADWGAVGAQKIWMPEVAMIDRTFEKHHKEQMIEVQALLEENPSLFVDLLRPSPRESHEDEVVRQEFGDGDEPDGENSFGEWFYFHITSRIHLQRRLIKRAEVKAFLGELCLHYARACNVAVAHYCLMDNHFHLEVGVRAVDLVVAKAAASKLIGCVKQRFTNIFKAWYNGDYRKEKRYRYKALGKGTLWDGRPHIGRIKDDAQLAACTLYVETNRIKATCSALIQALEEPPCVLSAEESQGEMQPGYQALLDELSAYPFQSARWYLDGCKGSDPVLTDGSDGIWATDAELKIWWRESVAKLPKGWRKVWFKLRPGILKPTPCAERRYLISPFFQRLGSTPEERGRTFGRLVMGMCWHGRHRLEAEDDETDYPGVSNI
ncbi:MAG: transposase [Bradymonadaceae bacterium]|nr:transposase [Lujinxingiaceae bacterium]